MAILVVGQVLIIIGWAEQAYRMLVRRHRSFSPFFLALYIVGAAALAAGSFQQNEIAMGVLSVVTALATLIILINVLVKSKKPEVF